MIEGHHGLWVQLLYLALENLLEVLGLVGILDVFELLIDQLLVHTLFFDAGEHVGSFALIQILGLFVHLANRVVVRHYLG